MLCCWRWCNIEVKSAALESERSWFKSRLFHFPAMWPWVGPLISLNRNRASIMRWFWWSDKIRYVGHQHITGRCHGCQHLFQFLQGWGCLPLPSPHHSLHSDLHIMGVQWMLVDRIQKSSWTETSRCINQPASQVSSSDLPTWKVSANLHGSNRHFFPTNAETKNELSLLPASEEIWCCC